MTGTAIMAQYAAASIRRLCVVPEDLTVTAWAEKYRVLPETSASPGAFQATTVPYARRWMDLGGDPSVSMLVLCWAAQTIKSTVIENILAYRICRSPSPQVVVQPKIDAAESWAKERFKPMVLATPALRDRVQLGRATESTLRYFRYPGGFTFIASSGSASELASRSAPVVALDEVDRYESIPGEGNPVEIVLRRQGSSDVGLAILTSTPRDAETTIIWPYLEGGTYEFYHVPCPLCGEMQPLAWGNLEFDDGNPRVVWYRCVACEKRFDERAKPEMLAAGDWVPTHPDAEYPSSHLNALYSPFAKSSWLALKAEWQRAQGKPADLQVFVNTRLAELWQESGESTNGDALLQRLEAHTEGVVPDGVGVLTAGVDVQAGSLHAYVWGWGAGIESWCVASAILPGEPDREPDQPGSVWAALDAWLWQTWRTARGVALPLSCVLVDSGYATSQVYRYTRRRASRRVYAVKGVGGEGVPIIGKPTPQGKERVLLYALGTDAAKREFLRSQLPERVHGPGYVHLPDWFTSAQCDELVAERRVRRVLRGKVVYEWRKKTDDARNEALDCRNYARGALEVLGSRTISNLGALAAEYAAAAEQPAAAAEPPASSDDAPARPARPRSFVHGWR